MNFSKNESLAMKGIAILMMYVHHFYFTPERWEGYSIDFFPLTAGSTEYIALFFKICVCIFVFITGFGMTMSIKKKDTQLDVPSPYLLSYSKRRLVSLLSNFIFVFLLSVIVSFPTGRFTEVYGKSGSDLQRNMVVYEPRRGVHCHIPAARQIISGVSMDLPSGSYACASLCRSENSGQRTASVDSPHGCWNVLRGHQPLCAMEGV